MTSVTGFETSRGFDDICLTGVNIVHRDRLHFKIGRKLLNSIGEFVPINGVISRVIVYLTLKPVHATGVVTKTNYYIDTDCKVHLLVLVPFLADSSSVTPMFRFLHDMTLRCYRPTVLGN